ncbi:MAG: D-Ala-D-Ala carboxypeptidase family metallohydrolase [Eubacteriaceae bacterium]
MYLLEIQTALNQKGYSPGPLDGIDGPLTRAAIRLFQKDNGLAVDGIVGNQTHQTLFTDIPESPPLIGDQLTPHFNRDEFKCCCNQRYCDGFPREMNPDLLNKLEALRINLNDPLIITSGVRCPTRNSEVGGVSFSKHLKGDAVDCYSPNIPVQMLAQAALRQGFGVIVYEVEEFCHLEV